MFYGFSKETLQCCWSANYVPARVAEFVVVESSEDYSLSDIMLDSLETKNIVPRVKDTEELVAENEAQRDVLMGLAKDQISLLSDVMEFAPTDATAVKLEQWRQYRVDLYNMDLELGVFPTQPEK